jgi:D-alanyl-D-alanine dipeptidase
MDVKALSYVDLINIPVTESHEPMANLLEVAPQVECAPINADALAYCPGGILVRKSVAEKLHMASAKVAERHPGAKLRVVYGYRHPSIQEQYYQQISTKIQRENPSLSANEVIERTHALIAVPSVAGHPTGAAVDVTISLNGTSMDMGTPIWDLESTSLIPTFAPGISEQQRANRLLLRAVLMSVGFAPFDGEWWHFSYGDREWAAYYKQPHALYAPMELSSRP